MSFLTKSYIHALLWLWLNASQKRWDGVPFRRLPGSELWDMLNSHVDLIAISLLQYIVQWRDYFTYACLLAGSIGHQPRKATVFCPWPSSPSNECLLCHLYQSDNPLFVNYFHTDKPFRSSLYTYLRSQLYSWCLYCIFTLF